MMYFILQTFLTVYGTMINEPILELVVSPFYTRLFPLLDYTTYCTLHVEKSAVHATMWYTLHILQHGTLTIHSTVVFPTKLNKKHNKQIKNKRRKALREGRLATVTADKFTLQLLQQSTRCNNRYIRLLHITTVTTVN